MATVEARVAAAATAEEGVEEEVKEAEAETAAGERVALQKHTMAHSASVTGAYTVAMRVFKVVCTARLRDRVCDTRASKRIDAGAFLTWRRRRRRWRWRRCEHNPA
jgi:hypothetical protein